MWDYNGAHVVSRVYWTSLAILDPLAAALLLWKPRSGLLLTVVIVVSNVAHNTWVMLESSAPDWQNSMYLLQVLFLTFVLATVRIAWRDVPGAKDRSGCMRTVQREIGA